MSERDDFDQREFDLKWADGAAHKEPSARARMLAARWKHDPPGPVPFRPEPARKAHRPRSPWVSAAIVFGAMAALILLLGYANFRPH
ncbi:hypothetical protein [Streptomyces bullii]|uniref:DUF3040 domain-containing protein n=1 Tax=Streptomyces bullii TaxID=349910 RepID=A0ABW0V1C9_9ACTN